VQFTVVVFVVSVVKSMLEKHTSEVLENDEERSTCASSSSSGHRRSLLDS
jgi:hypothetical protein